MFTTKKVLKISPVILLIAAVFMMPSSVRAHCDTMDGPVIKDAENALAIGDIAPILKWVKKEYEPEIRDAFEKTLIVRAESPQAKNLADRYFFETLVRVHRAGEGAPYTGLKPPGSTIDPAVTQADMALETGSIDGSIAVLTKAMEAGIRSRFEEALGKRRHVQDSIQAGREYVEAYVQFVHYVENLHKNIQAHTVHQIESNETGSVHKH